ncbi:hypothetical protein GRX03_10920 [Halovenus sp. WSH3]|uniref:DUF7979 domain-containing protein n=1 Tax=Halovenus carboxidivorans TaxID=2692199 RepID=A0A6B0TFZ7_9EURY|nr:hypothetical protein [Halovenus carboxidivorans]MXR52109.1 hypothetical protein [Halovenus carboxidivorans]
MAPVPTVNVLLLIAAPVCLVGGAIAVYLTSKGTLPVYLLYILLGVAVAVVTLLGAGVIDANGEKIEYTVEQCPDRGGENGTDNRTMTAETRYSELSPEAQDVFRSALEASRAGEVYVTRRHPEEFDLLLDTTQNINEIQYESECYELTAQYTGNVQANILSALVSVVGLGIAVGLAVGGLIRRRRRQRQRWIEADTLEESGSRRCPDCNRYIGADAEECQRCGWSSPDNGTQDSD